MTAVAVALAQPPLAEGNAPGRCGLALLRGLAAHGVDVRAVAAARTFAGAPAQPDEVAADLPVRVVRQPMDVATGVAARARRAARGWQRPRGGLSGGPYDDAVSAAARDAGLLHLEELETGWSGAGSDVPRVLHVHYLTPLDRDPGPWGRRQWREYAEFSAAERRLARAHRWLVASAPSVADGLRTLAPGARVVELPLPLDGAGYPVAALDRPVAGLLGTLSWPPTADAVDRLLTRVWPRVRAGAPDASLELAGRGTAAVRTADPSVRVVGEVPEAAAFLAGLSVLLYPLGRGSGAKVKVLEAMACGVPVVTTTAGADGAPRSDGLLVVDDEDALVAAAAELLRDPQARRQRGAAARRDLLERHAPLPATAGLLDVYAEMVRTA